VWRGTREPVVRQTPTPPCPPCPPVARHVGKDVTVSWGDASVRETLLMPETSAALTSGPSLAALETLLAK